MTVFPEPVGATRHTFRRLGSSEVARASAMAPVAVPLTVTVPEPLASIFKFSFVPDEATMISAPAAAPFYFAFRCTRHYIYKVYHKLCMAMGYYSKIGIFAFCYFFRYFYI